MNDEFLTTDEVATKLRMKPSTIERMARRGDLPALRISRQYRYPVSALNKHLESLCVA
ncbi:helix-turn-helix domain-containing protein [Rhodopirellula halodulae]|uniref:helix-turn-helix domain-containing protein n=1 Tax=Rhodopirellula halodulae TaxID=2894198 RepID=UPI0032FC8624|nr:helix-turn-helix domain-containing protein [Rhodopirellula sp. JC737]